MPEPRVNAEIDAVWGEKAKRLLRAQMTLKGVNAAQLAEKLTAMGVRETEKNVANKIARGGFTAAFFLQCMTAMGVQTLHLES
jgi:3-mercaptopyruvate sulfurtransferase SseA